MLTFPSTLVNQFTIREYNKLSCVNLVLVVNRFAHPDTVLVGHIPFTLHFRLTVHRTTSFLSNIMVWLFRMNFPVWCTQGSVGSVVSKLCSVMLAEWVRNGHSVNAGWCYGSSSHYWRYGQPPSHWRTYLSWRLRRRYCCLHCSNRGCQVWTVIFYLFISCPYTILMIRQLLVNIVFLDLSKVIKNLFISHR